MSDRDSDRFVEGLHRMVRLAAVILRAADGVRLRYSVPGRDGLVVVTRSTRMGAVAVARSVAVVATGFCA